MELIQLLYFMEVAKYENMTLAANKNHISQQALSKSIRKLEQELGAELFDRRNRRLSLNASGRLALDQIQDIFTSIETLKKTIGRISSPQELVIGSSSLISIRTLILNFNNAYPNFLISTNSIPEDHLFEKLQRRQIDVAISVQKYPLSSPNICSFPVFQETLLLAVPSDDPLSKKNSVCLQELNGRNILRLKTCELYLDHIFDSLCKKNRIKTNFIWHNDYVIFNGLWNNPQYSFLTSTLHDNLEYHNHIRLPFDEPQLTVAFYAHFLNDNVNAEIFSSWARQISA